MASDEQLDTRSSQVVVKQVFKSPTHRELLGKDNSSGVMHVMKRPVGLSPSQAVSNTIYQVDSATEKSSLYPPYMISKLDPK